MYVPRHSNARTSVFFRASFPPQTGQELLEKLCRVTLGELFITPCTTLLLLTPKLIFCFVASQPLPPVSFDALAYKITSKCVWI